MRGFKSYLMFMGKSMSSNVVILMSGAFVVIVAAKLVSVYGGNPEAWDFMRFLGEVMWITDIMYVLRGLFNANLRSAPGYRFFHALPDSARHYKYAIIMADTSLIVGTAIFAGTDFLLFEDTSPMLFAALALFSLGWMNLFGNMGVFWIYLIPIFVIGFSNGFLNGISDDEELTDTRLQFAVLIVCSVFCAVGIAYTSINSRKLWNKEK